MIDTPLTRNEEPFSEPVRPSDRVNWNKWARFANDVSAALDHLDHRFLFTKRSRVAKELWEKGYREVPVEQYAITELSLNLPFPPPEDEIHPARTPIGPFDTYLEADIYARARCDEHGGGSWTVSKMVKP
jgi:hypothetical protein